MKGFDDTCSRPSKKGVILNLIQNLLSLMKAGDTGSEPGMTKSWSSCESHTLIRQSRKVKTQWQSRLNQSRGVSSPLEGSATLVARGVIPQLASLVFPLRSGTYAPLPSEASAQAGLNPLSRGGFLNLLLIQTLS